LNRKSDKAAHTKSADQPRELLIELGRLREKLRQSRDVRGELDEVLGSLAGALDQVMVEHSGMADELIATYEQLGIVFEVTRQLPNVHDESEIVELFIENLRGTFAGRRVHPLRPLTKDAWSLEGRLVGPHTWLAGIVKRATERRSVLVEEPPGGAIGLEHVRAAQVMIGPVHAGDDLACAIVLIRPQEAPEFRAVDMLLIESLTKFCGDLIRNLRLMRELQELSMAMVRSLVSAVDQKDEYTCGHSLRVAYFATELGKRLDLGTLELQMLEWAALLHDVGKIGIRDNVLKKPGRLNQEEFDHIKEHPVRSHKVVQGVPQLADALDGILYHHERYDGGGYPSGLKGEQIPLQARIIQIADVFDALTSNRSYRGAFTWEKALAILGEEAGRTVDPRLQQVFDSMIREALDGPPEAWEQMIERANRFKNNRPQMPPYPKE
jgi:hypothetical protein